MRTSRIRSAVAAAALALAGEARAAPNRNFSGESAYFSRHERFGADGTSEYSQTLDLHLRDDLTRRIKIGLDFAGTRRRGGQSPGSDEAITPHLEFSQGDPYYQIGGVLREQRGSSTDQPDVIRRVLTLNARTTPRRFIPVTVRWNRSWSRDQADVSRLDQEDEQAYVMTEGVWQGIHLAVDGSRSSFRDLVSAAPEVVQLSTRLRGDIARRIRFVPALEGRARFDFDSNRTLVGGIETGENERYTTQGDLTYTPSPWFRTVQTAEVTRTLNRKALSDVSDGTLRTDLTWRLMPGVALTGLHTYNEARWGEPTGAVSRRTVMSASVGPWDWVSAGANAVLERSRDKATGRLSGNRQEYGADIFARATPDLDLDLDFGYRQDPFIPTLDRTAGFSAVYRGIRNSELRTSGALGRTLAARSRTLTTEFKSYMMGGNLRFSTKGEYARSEPLAGDPSDRWLGEFGFSWSHQNRLYVDARIEALQTTGSDLVMHLPASASLLFHPARFLLGRLRWTGSDLLHAAPDQVQFEVSSSGAPDQATLSAIYSLTVDHDGPESQNFNVQFRRWF